MTRNARPSMPGGLSDQLGWKRINIAIAWHSGPANKTGRAVRNIVNPAELAARGRAGLRRLRGQRQRAPQRSRNATARPGSLAAHTWFVDGGRHVSQMSFGATHGRPLRRRPQSRFARSADGKATVSGQHRADGRSRGDKGDSPSMRSRRALGSRSSRQLTQKSTTANFGSTRNHSSVSCSSRCARKMRPS